MDCEGSFRVIVDDSAEVSGVTPLVRRSRNSVHPITDGVNNSVTRKLPGSALPYNSMTPKEYWALTAGLSACLGRNAGMDEVREFAGVVRLCSGICSSTESESDDKLSGLLYRSQTRKLKMGRRKIHTSPETAFPAPPNSENLRWVDVEVLRTECWYSSEPALELAFRHVDYVVPGRKEDWVVELPGENDRICTQGTLEKPFVPMYKCVFTDLGVRLPFADFETGILRYLNVAPSQLHPNAWGFIRSFTALCDALGLSYNTDVFFHMFKPYPVVDKNGREAWLALRSGPGDKLFEVYQGSYKLFKESFAFFRPLEGGRRWLFNEDGTPKFPLYWTQAHFNLRSKDYVFSLSELNDEEVATIEALQAFKKDHGIQDYARILNGGTWSLKERIEDMAGNNMLALAEKRAKRVRPPRRRQQMLRRPSSLWPTCRLHNLLMLMPSR